MELKWSLLPVLLYLYIYKQSHLLTNHLGQWRWDLCKLEEEGPNKWILPEKQVPKLSLHFMVLVFFFFLFFKFLSMKGKWLLHKMFIKDLDYNKISTSKVNDFLSSGMHKASRNLPKMHSQCNKSTNHLWRVVNHHLLLAFTGFSSGVKSHIRL